MTDTAQGAKYDAGKPRYDLMQFTALEFLRGACRGSGGKKPSEMAEAALHGRTFEVAQLAEWIAARLNGMHYGGSLDPLSPALEAYASVLAFGASKYSAHSWRNVPDLQGRYRAAAFRHVKAYLQAPADSSDELDHESGLPHLAHAFCCCMFVLEDLLDSGAAQVATPVAPAAASQPARDYIWLKQPSGTARRVTLSPKSIDDLPTWWEIERSLKGQRRWTGHGADWNVAEHSIMVSRLLFNGSHAIATGYWPARKAALVHDASEALYGDVSTPVKKFGVTREYRDRCKGFDALCLEKLDLRLPAFSTVDAIKRADNVSAYFEAKDLLGVATRELDEWFPGLNPTVTEYRAWEHIYQRIKYQELTWLGELAALGVDVDK